MTFVFVVLSEQLVSVPMNGIVGNNYWGKCLRYADLFNLQPFFWKLSGVSLLNVVASGFVYCVRQALDVTGDLGVALEGIPRAAPAFDAESGPDPEKVLMNFQREPVEQHHHKGMETILSEDFAIFTFTAESCEYMDVQRAQWLLHVFIPCTRNWRYSTASHMV